MKIGIIGFPNVGKSSLFQTLTNQEVLIENRPFATIHPNIGHLIVKDKRLQVLQKIYNSKKIIYPVIPIIDIAGLIKDSHKGKGLGNKFLSSARETNLLLLVVRHFSDKKNICDELIQISLVDQVKTIYLELLYSDYEIVQKILPKLHIQIKKNPQNIIKSKIKVLNKFISLIEKEEYFIQNQFTSDEVKEIKEFNFFWPKSVYILINTDSLSSQWKDENIFQLQKFLEIYKINSTKINIKFENELINYNKEEKKEVKNMASEYIEQIDDFVTDIFRISQNKIFFTCGENEVKGWICKNNSNAKEAAGIIHSDIKKNFTILEKFNFNQLKLLKNPINKNMIKTLITFKDKNYIVQDGDICYFRFNKPK